MPSIKEKSTVEAIAKAFCEHRCKSRALQAGGYSVYYSERAGLKLFRNVQLKQAIARIDAKTAAKLDHNRDIAIDLLTTNLKRLKTKADAGDVQAISAATAVIRELSAISGLHSSTVNNKSDIPSEPVAYRAWLSAELARLDDSKAVLAAYEATRPAIALRRA